jgi:hypothetical protein
VLGPEAMSDLLVRLVVATEDMGRDVREMRADLRILLEEGRAHAARLVAVERSLAALPCRGGSRCPEEAAE